MKNNIYEKKIKQLVEELYLLDKNLKNQEEELMGVIRELVVNKPEVKVDKLFVKKLRAELLMKSKKRENDNKFNWMFSGRMALAGVGLVILALIIIPYYSLKNNDLDSLSRSRVAMENLGDRAFGNLVLSSDNSATTFSEGKISPETSVNNSRAIGLGAGGQISDTMISSKMIMPNPVVYEYKYVGEDFAIDYKTAKVIKRKTISGFPASQVNLSEFEVGEIDYNRFKNLHLTNLNLSEDINFGYNLNLDLLSGNLSIYANWEKWPQVDCQNEACFKDWQLKISDMPSDEKIVEIADKFLSDYGVNMSVYGKGQIFSDWRDRYDRSEDKSNFYIPEAVNIVYPLIIGGQIVYDEQANVSGLGVVVNVRYNKVYNVRDVIAQNYQSSDYEAFTNKEEIISIAEKGGFRNYNYYVMDNTQAKEIELDTPSLELVKIWQYDQSKRKGEELFIPAYIFPVIQNENSDMYYRKAVIVPIVKELIEHEQNNILEPMPLPAVRGGNLDMIKEAAIEGSAAEIQIMIKK